MSLGTLTMSNYCQAMSHFGCAHAARLGTSSHPYILIFLIYRSSIKIPVKQIHFTRYRNTI